MDTQSALQSPAGGSRPWLLAALYVLIILCVAAGFVGVWWADSMPSRVDEQQTVVVGQTRLAPGSNASLRVVVQDFGQGKPIAGAQVKLSLQPAGGQAVPLYEGQTDENGSLPVSFRVPADAPADATLIVESRSPAGQDRVEQPVTIEREYRLLLSSDKPLYQPGQVIHMRALALSTYDLAPARGAQIDFLVEDPKGNKVFRRSATASDFGVAAADFTLADLVIQGNYKLVVSIGDTRSEMTVEVRPYVLPKFAVTISTDRTFYLPGQRVEGSVQADYFFGKPVAQGQVQVVGAAWDGLGPGRTVAVDLRGQTNEEGTYAFAFDLPAYFAGSGLESGQAQFALEVTVIDQTDHAEQNSQVLPIAAQPLVIEAVAESGTLRPGVENIVYILTAYPDGRPAPAQLQVGVDAGAPVELAAGEFGLARFSFVPQSAQAHVLDITARDQAGLSARRSVNFQAEQGADSVLLRADRAAYLVGETMNLVVLTPVESGSIYLDIVKAGQTLSTRSARVENGQAEFAVDVSPDLYGTLELHAYKVLLDGTLVRDTRVVMVDAPKDIDIAITADKDTYVPGELATLGFKTTAAAQGAGVQTALGLAIVDESVFALQRQDPGFAKLYFMLEQELLEPFYQIKGFELPADIPPAEDQLRLAQDDAAKASWAGASVMAAAQPINSRQQKMAAVYQSQENAFRFVGVGSTLGMILVPLALWAVVVAALWRSGVVKRSLVGLLVALAIVVVGVCAVGFLFAAPAAWYDMEEILTVVLLALGGGACLSLLGLIGYAWVKRDTPAKFLTLLMLAWPAWAALLVLAVDRGGEPDEGLVIAGLLAYVLVPGAYLLFGQMRWVQGQRLAGGLATTVGAVSVLPALLVIPGFFVMAGGATFGAGAPMPPMQALTAPLPTQAPVERGKGEEVTGRIQDQVAGAEAPRLRQYFPETLYWAPEVVTDKDGFVSLEIPMADSITTWRLTALASSQDGRLGFTTRGIRVFQDFFVDIDLPVALTQGDEISIPVGVFNYLPEAQSVRLEVKPEDWFELLGEAEQTLTIASNDIQVVYFPIRVLRFGRQGFQVTAWGQQMSDAIRREVSVVPDGKEIRLSQSDWLRESTQVGVEIPPEAVPETPYVEVKIYPGVMSQVVEGLEKILRLPHG